MNNIRKIIKSKFFEAVGDIGERSPNYMRMVKPSIKDLRPDDIGILEFNFSDKNTIKDAVESIFPLLDDLGVQYPNYDTEFGLVSMNVPYKVKDKVIDLMTSFGFSFNSETFGNEMRGGNSTAGRMGSYSSSSFGAGGSFASFPTGFQMTRLIGEGEESSHKVVFIDFDGTVRDAIPTTNGDSKIPPFSVDEIKVFDGIGKKIKAWKDAGYVVFGVSNQAGAIDKKMKELNLPREEIVKKIQVVFDKTIELINKQVGEQLFADAYFSKEKGDDHKPNTGMAKKALTNNNIQMDLENSFMIGDWEPTDGKLAKNLGIKFLKVDEKKLGSDFPLPPTTQSNIE